MALVKDILTDDNNDWYIGAVGIVFCIVSLTILSFYYIHTGTPAAPHQFSPLDYGGGCGGIFTGGAAHMWANKTKDKSDGGSS